MNLQISNKNVYVVSDIHNDYTRFKKLLKEISFSKEDVLIIDGDIFDRGTEPVELYFEILKYTNIYVIQGNHDVWVCNEIEDKFGKETAKYYISYNTIDIMRERLTEVDLIDLAKWIKEKPYYINLELDGKKFQISHAQTYRYPERVIDKSWFYMGDLHNEEFIKGINTSDQFISVVGHTPTRNQKISILENNLIRIDCGCGFRAGRLGVIRLNDMKTFYE